MTYIFDGEEHEEHKLFIHDVMGYVVDGQRLEPYMIIRRYDEIAHDWFEGEVGSGSSFDPQSGQRHSFLSLVVPGFAPSPLQEGQTIEIVSKEELHNREMDRQNRIAYENRPKPWLKGWPDE